MWWLFLSLTLSAVAASPLFQEVTPGSILLQNITTELQEPISDALNVDQYLRTYGYMGDDVDELSQDYAQQRTDAIRSFQRFAGLLETGEADEDTLQQMLQPRCGMKDIEEDVPSDARWRVKVITYRFRSYTRDISRRSIRRAFVDGLRPWEVPSRLRFRRITRGTPIMEIEFVNRSHPPCRYNMDGPGGVLAHAYFPSRSPLGGDMHFDDAETYKYKRGRGIKLASIVLHEAGHALGLKHDRTRGSIMVPWYTGQTTLGPNDIRRIKSLYRN